MACLPHAEVDVPLDHAPAIDVTVDGADEVDPGPDLIKGHGGAPVRTDNGNLILDCAVGPIGDPPGLEQALRSIPGVVGTGPALGMAHTVLAWDQARVTTMTRRAPPTSDG